MKPVHRKLRVVSNKRIASDHYLLELEVDENISSLPGQFLQLRLEDSIQFLRRPFSIFDCENKIIKILYKLRGNVTSLMSKLKKSDLVDVIFPLGNHFPQPEKGKVVLVSGGTGFAPLHFLVKELLNNKNLTLEFLIGGKGREVEAFKNFLPSAVSVKIATENGSAGEKGLVTDLIADIEGWIYSAGPIAMLKAVYEKIKVRENPAYFSLEAHFACGLGLCWGCVLPTREGFVRVCKEGPVFSPYVVKWEEI